MPEPGGITQTLRPDHLLIVLNQRGAQHHLGRYHLRPLDWPLVCRPFEF